MDIGKAASTFAEQVRAMDSKQNTSHAVMSQRTEPHDSLDHFPTPPWATRALFEHVIGGQRGYLGWEPACGEGAMLGVMYEYMEAAAGSDVHDYGKGYMQHDFLQPYMPDGIGHADWIITNPPFRLAQQFIIRAMNEAEVGVCVLVRSVFIESVGRYNDLFKNCPPVVMAQFVERVPMVKGRLDPDASTATSYCWLVFPGRESRRAHEGTKLIWIPPCRSKLERADDYPPLSSAQSK